MTPPPQPATGTRSRTGTTCCPCSSTGRRSGRGNTRTRTGWPHRSSHGAGAVALFAKGGTGKSLLALWIAAALATGRPVFHRQRPPVHVLYLDYEMSEDDLKSRLESMGYDADHDLTHLHYALLPQMAPLDGEAGGKTVAALAALVAAELVVTNTFGRAVSGDGERSGHGARLVPLDRSGAEAG